MSPSVQLSFNLRTSSKARSVHLVGSWDNYQRQLPLSDVKPGSWKGTFRFQGSQALQLGSRYWYFYYIDGYQVTHDPAKESVTEKTTGRKLNILDVPAGTSQPTKAPTASRTGLTVQTQNLPKTSHRSSREIPHGTPLTPAQIICPRPQKPYASRTLREADYEMSPVDDLEERFAASRISSRSYASSPSDVSSVSSSGSTFSSPASASPSSCSSFGPACKCERFGVTRDGRRVRLDCGGSKCAYGDSSDCSTSDEESSDDEALRQRIRARVSAKQMTRTAEVTRERREVRSERRYR